MIGLDGSTASTATLRARARSSRNNALISVDLPAPGRECRVQFVGARAVILEQGQRTRQRNAGTVENGRGIDVAGFHRGA